MEGGQEVRLEAAVLDGKKPSVLLGILCSRDAGTSSGEAQQLSGARAGSVKHYQTGQPWCLCWPAASGTTSVSVTVGGG